MKGTIFRKETQRDSQEHILLQISFYAGILCYAGALVNTFHRREVMLYLSTLIPALGFSIIYYYGKFRQKFRLSGIGLIAALLITVNIQWQQTYGISGNMLIVFFAIEILVVVFTDIRKQIAVTALILTNVLVLLYLEYKFPDAVPTPKDKKTVLIDLAVSFSLTSVGLFFILRIALNNYISQKNRWQNIFQAIGQPAFILSPEKRIIDVNEATLKVAGMSKEEFIGMRCNKLFHGSCKPENCPVNQSLNSEKTEVEEMPIELLNGTFMVTCTPIFVKGKLDHIIHVATDITEKKRFEKTLIENEERLNILFEKASDAIYISDLSGNILKVNEKAVEQTGFSTEELLTMNVLEIDRNPAGMEELKKLFGNMTDETKIFESTHRRKDGSYIPVEITSSKIQGIDEELIMGISRDISERKAANEALKNAMEKAVEADKLKTAFLANMSHEIRTPMNGILGFANLLKEARLSSEIQIAYIDIIEKSGERMLNIINDLIDISKIEAGQMEVVNSTFNIDDQLEYLHTFFKPGANEKNLKLNYHRCPNASDLILFTDKEKLLAILINLVKNAIKYTNEGSIEFGCSSKNRFLEFYVKDTGIGIAPEKHEAVFDRFVQADLSIQKPYEGAGLGLAITKAYVNMLGGEIWLESEPGKGSTFYFTLPYKQKKEDKIPELVPEKSPAKIDNLTILVADDDETSMLFITVLLKNHCKQILMARTGNEAVDKCAANKEIDVILMDIKMPGMDGYSATRKIRTFNSNVYIIAQTAYALSGEAEKALESGCNDYISKPFQREELLEKIRRSQEIQSLKIG